MENEVQDGAAAIAAREAKATANRDAMPVLGAFVAELTRVFGRVRVRYACENGIVRGTRAPDGEGVVPSPPVLTVEQMAANDRERIAHVESMYGRRRRKS